MTTYVSGPMTSLADGIPSAVQTPSVAVTFSATAMSVNCDLSNVFTTTLDPNLADAVDQVF